MLDHPRVEVLDMRKKAGQRISQCGGPGAIQDCIDQMRAKRVRRSGVLACNTDVQQVPLVDATAIVSLLGELHGDDLCQRCIKVPGIDAFGLGDYVRVSHDDCRRIKIRLG